jgi:HPt (histidine-containing phosphotransfer) domain-containing protein
MSTPDDLFARLEGLAVLDMATIADLRDPELDGDDAFRAEVIEIFLSDSPQHLTAIQDGVADGNAPVVMRAAHTLRGSSANFGAARLQLLCTELEVRARSGQLQGLEPLAARVEAEFALLVAELDALVRNAGITPNAAC